MLRIALIGFLVVAGIVCATDARTEQSEAHQTLRVPAGHYYPFFNAANNASPVPVCEFWLDPAPATRAEYLEFVLHHPQWRKSRVKPLLAETSYLADWPDDLNPGNAPRDRPVTFVSWFAARAYCSAHAKRLPTVAEWERVAGGDKPGMPSAYAASATVTGSEPFRFAMGTPAPDLGRQRLDVGEVWEWNADFNSAPLAAKAGITNQQSSLFCGDGYRSTNALDYAAFLRYSLRSSLRGNYTLKNLGFRCARDEP